MMKNKLTRLFAVTAVSAAVMSGVSFAETGAGTASVEVKNSFTVLQTTPLSFGQIAAIASEANAEVVTLQVFSDGTTADLVDDSAGASVASIVSITPGTAGTFTVSGAAPNTDLTIVLPTNVELKDPSSADDKSFYLTDFTTTSITSGTAFSYDTDATGTLVFNIGATLSTDNLIAANSTAQSLYKDVTFTGTYDVTVNY
jgi:hypothetical protein